MGVDADHDLRCCVALGLPRRRSLLEEKRLGPLDQARNRSLASFLIGPVNPGRQIFWKTMTGSRVGLRRVRPELLGFPGLTQTCWAGCSMVPTTRCWRIFPPLPGPLILDGPWVVRDLLTRWGQQPGSVLGPGATVIRKRWRSRPTSGRWGHQPAGDLPDPAASDRSWRRGSSAP